MNVYIVMGTHLPEMRQCLRFLARADEDVQPAGLLLPQDIPWPEESEPWSLQQRYDACKGAPAIPAADLSTLWIVVDPRHSPVPQLEALAAVLRQRDLPPARIITCVDCSGVEQHTALRGWFDASIYYSDIVLLGNRRDATNAFLRDYQRHYERLCYPCLFLLLKGPGNPEQPLEILVPDARRLSQLFDFGADATIPEVPGVTIEASCDLDLEEAEDDPFRPAEEIDRAPVHVPDATPWIVPVTSC